MYVYAVSNFSCKQVCAAGTFPQHIQCEYCKFSQQEIARVPVRRNFSLRSALMISATRISLGLNYWQN